MVADKILYGIKHRRPCRPGKPARQCFPEKQCRSARGKYDGYRLERAVALQQFSGQFIKKSFHPDACENTQKTEDRWQKAEDRWRSTEDGRRNNKDGNGNWNRESLLN